MCDTTTNMRQNVFYPKAIVVTVETERLSNSVAKLLNLGARVLGIEGVKHFPSKTNVVALLKNTDDVKADIVRRKVEFLYNRIGEMK